MRFPTPQAYGEALQFPKLSVLDSVLKGGTVQTDALGLPFGRTGSFAITFKIAANGKNFAYRCFLQDRATMQERYDGISSFLASVHLPFFVDFVYIDAGVQVDGEELPTVRMQWADGVPLGLYLQDHHDDPGRMTALQQQIQGMALVLHSAGIAHGDIQGGNVLVGSGGEIKLVDYDGMFVPTISNLGAIETGHPNFQHPQRSAETPFDIDVDNFSFAVLHTVLSALVEDSSLWESLDSDSDRFLLGEADFADPFTSPAFAALTALPNTGRFARWLQAISASSYAEIPSFTDFLNSRNIPTVTAPPGQQNRVMPATSSSEQPWYRQTPVITTTPSQATAHHSDLPVCDAGDPDEWLNLGGTDVELIGVVESVNLTTVDGSPVAIIHLEHPWEEGDPYICVLVDHLARTDLAMRGEPLGSLWEGSWMSASGLLTAHDDEEGEETDDSDEYFYIYIDDSSALILLDEDEALSKIEQFENDWQEVDVESVLGANTSNSDAIIHLDGAAVLSEKASTPLTSGIKPGYQQASPPFAPSALKKKPMSTFSAFLLAVGIALGTVFIAVVVVIIGFVFGSPDAVNGPGTSSKGNSVSVGDCLSGGGTRRVTDCDSASAAYRVEQVVEDLADCKSGTFRFTHYGTRVCAVELSQGETAQTLAVGDCVSSSNDQVACSSSLAVATVAALRDVGILCDSNQTPFQVSGLTPTDKKACLDPIMDYRTCIAYGEVSDPVWFGLQERYEAGGDLDECFDKLGWYYEDAAFCWSLDAVDLPVLQQFMKKSARWETVKTNIASDKLSCSESDPDFPWDIAFDRKASTPGVKDYRVLFPDGNWFEIVVTVTEEPRS